METGESHVPPELLGYSRDSVKLLVLDRRSGTISSDRFSKLSDYLRKGDRIVTNNSGLINASLMVYFKDVGHFGKVNIGTTARDRLILLEPRPKNLNALLKKNSVAEIVGSGKTLKLVRRDGKYRRYWWADFKMTKKEIFDLAAKIGFPITYEHLHYPVGIDDYSTIFSRVSGSVEPPSAGFPLTKEVKESLEKRGIKFSELTLHCNLGSLEPSEFSTEDTLLEENYMIPVSTLNEIAKTKENGGRVIALGTTVVRALESFKNMGISSSELTSSMEEVFNGKTDLFIKGGVKISTVDGIITGMHAGNSSHLDMIAAFVGPELLETAYSVAREWGYLWHEFGDSTLII